MTIRYTLVATHAINLIYLYGQKIDKLVMPFLFAPMGALVPIVSSIVFAQLYIVSIWIDDQGATLYPKVAIMYYTLNMYLYQTMGCLFC